MFAHSPLRLFDTLSYESLISLQLFLLLPYTAGSLLPSKMKRNLCGALSPGKYIYRYHGPLTRYVKYRIALALGMPGTFSQPSRVGDPDMHHGTCMTHMPWCMPGSLTSGFLWSWWRGKRSRHSRCIRNLQFYVSGKRPMEMTKSLFTISVNSPHKGPVTRKKFPFDDVIMSMGPKLMVLAHLQVQQWSQS